MDALPYLCIKAHVVFWPVCTPQLLAASVQGLVASSIGMKVGRRRTF